MLERRVGCGPGEDVSPRAKMFSALMREGVLFADSRLCQSKRGEEAASEALKGDDWNGEESNILYCSVLASGLFQSLRNAVAWDFAGPRGRPTVVACASTMHLKRV